ncbi:MAG: DUF2914 domain-containing protein [Pseudomonadales bacterium]|nr:DUF2914 domain-containing protein [Pseudomonadales bacterium]
MSEQTPEFNHYQNSAPEFTETILWHRVYGAIGLVVLLLAALIWGSITLFSAEDSKPTTHTPAISAVADIQQLPASNAIPADTEQHNTLEQTERQNESLQVDTESEVSEQAEGLVKEQAEEHEVEVLNVALANSQQTPVSEPVVSGSVVSKPGNSPDSNYPVQIEIFNSDITSATLTDKMNRLEPAYALQNTSELDSPFIKLYFFTDLNGRAGDTLTYYWYRNNKQVAKVRVPVGSDRWRNHSSKNMSKEMRGDWKVIVKDRAGETMAKAQFTLKPVL